MAVRLKEKYKSEIVPELKEVCGRENVMSIPRLEKVVINMGIGEAAREAKLIDGALAELTLIAGQKPKVRMAKKSISNFKLREGMKIGAAVTLRGDRMYDFFDRLVNVAIPRVRDFRGVPKKFDNGFNYTLGIKDQSIFPEIVMDDVSKVHGMNVTFVIRNTNSANESAALLTKLGMPFVKSANTEKE